MESTNLRKWLQVLDVANKLEFDRLQKLFLFGTASLRAQTYFRSSLLSTHFGEEKPRPEIRLCPQAREQQGSLEEYRTWDKSQQQKSRNISRYIIKSRNITLIIFFAFRAPFLLNKLQWIT